MLRSIAFLSLFVSLPGCVFVLGGGKACDTSAASSVAVTLSADDGGDIADAVVTFSVEGGPFQPCDAFPGDGEYSCGWEAAGNLVVRAEAVGYATVEEAVFIEQGECHVIPQHVDLLLLADGVDCTAEEVPSVIATVAGSSGEALSDVAVSWGYRDAEMAPQPCDERGDGEWACGAEVAGDLEIYAEAGGHAGEMVGVHVEADECHVITEHVAFELDWLPD
ncbi:MAG: hypothetical protein Q8P41_32265 [Pseudomonadota bacterium]|nr:hypothetical protein [Pseudomonadota bacterium]